MAYIISALLALLVYPLPVNAAPPLATVEEVVTAVEKGYAGLKDLQADFTQKTAVAGLDREQKGNGELLLKRPEKAAAMFRFNYAKPKQQIISNGRQVWFYTPENRQVIVSDVATLFSGGNSIALSYLTGLGHLSRDFDISFASQQQDRGGNYQLELIPKKSSQLLARLSLTVSAETVEQLRRDGEVIDQFPIVASTIHDAAGNRTRIDYSRVRPNRGIDSSKFTFKIPAGVEVVKQ